MDINTEKMSNHQPKDDPLETLRNLGVEVEEIQEIDRSPIPLPEMMQRCAHSSLRSQSFFAFPKVAKYRKWKS